MARIPSTALRDLDASRICLIKPSALGDVVQTLPLLGMLRRRFPTATISWVIRRSLSDILVGHPDLTEVIRFYRRGSWLDSFHLLNLLRLRRFDLVFDLQGLLRSAAMTLATRAAVRVGLETAREGAALAYNCLLPESGHGIPAHARYWRIAEALGLGDHPRTAVIPVTAAEKVWLGDRLRHLPRPILALHPGAGWKTKCWPVEKFAEIARRFDGTVLVLGAPSERHLAGRVVDAAAAGPNRVLNMAGETSLKQLTALLGSVDLVVSNDSGPMHVAAAQGTPVVGIFTCTSPQLSGPAGGMHELISTGVSCAASYHKTCPRWGRAHLACLDDVSVERVWNAVVRVVERRELKPRRA
jgi:lipopolysaccharide heptosyltransferase II